MKIIKSIPLVVLFFVMAAQMVHAFSFSEYEKTEHDNIPKLQNVSEVATRVSCLKGEKIAIMIGARGAGLGDVSGNGSFDPLVIEFNRQLKKLGLKTYSPAEINSQIAQEEQDAFLGNDLDAAASAAARLRAKYLLKGSITTLTRINRIVGIDELFLTISLNLVDEHGKDLANTQLSEAVFSDYDIVATAKKLVREKSLQALAVMFKDYCKK